MLRHETCILLLLCLLPACVSAQSKGSADPCDKDVTFCWYGPYTDGSEEVKAWGKRWLANDHEKSLDFPTALRCVKRMDACIKAENVILSGGTMLRIEILPVTGWTSQQVTAEGENAKLEPCDQPSYIINRVDRTVLMISSPGPLADGRDCKAVMGKPKTTIYRLSQ